MSNQKQVVISDFFFGKLCGNESSWRQFSGCFEDGIAIDTSVYSLFTLPKVASAECCQRLCANHGECQYFTFYKASGGCRLVAKEYLARWRVKSADGISGPRNCVSYSPGKKKTSNCTHNRQLLNIFS